MTNRGALLWGYTRQGALDVGTGAYVVKSCRAAGPRAAAHNRIGGTSHGEG